MRGSNKVGDLPSLVALAHELKAPLGLIRQLALTRDYYDGAERDQALRRIELAAERSLRLVEALTMTYRSHKLTSEPINLTCLCEEVAHELTPLCSENNQTIELRLPRQPLLAVGHRDLLSSVVFGLCDNALAYGTHEQPIELRASRQQNKARIAVSDRGPGLAKHQLSDITARLGNAPQPTSNRPGSSGLGLYIAKQFAEAMQGELGMRQSERRGQSFYIDIPRSQQLSLIV
jgi:signal transduction histidine kinase